MAGEAESGTAGEAELVEEQAHYFVAFIVLQESLQALGFLLSQLIL